VVSSRAIHSASSRSSAAASTTTGAPPGRTVRSVLPSREVLRAITALAASRIGRVER
jgi:hypothetical protein